jgi:hypothetical protein
MSLRGEISYYLGEAHWQWTKRLKRRKRKKHEKVTVNPCKICGVAESEGEHYDCQIDHYLLIRSDGSMQLEKELKTGATRGEVAFTLGGDKNRDSLLEGCHRYDPDGDHYPAADFYHLTWGEAKRLQTLFREMYYERYENDIH